MQKQTQDSLIEGLIKHFDSKGFKIVSANFGDFERCQKITRFEPDVIAYHVDNDVYSIGKAKTCEELEEEITIEEFQEFANVTIEKIGSERDFLPFCIAVPKKCMKTLELRIIESGLSLNGNIQPLGF